MKAWWEEPRRLAIYLPAVPSTAAASPVTTAATAAGPAAAHRTPRLGSRPVFTHAAAPFLLVEVGRGFGPGSRMRLSPLGMGRLPTLITLMALPLAAIPAVGLAVPAGIHVAVTRSRGLGSGLGTGFGSRLSA